MIIFKVLIDNGSTLNVCPAIILERVGIEEPMIHQDDMIVRAFDGTETSACGELDLEVLI